MNEQQRRQQDAVTQHLTMQCVDAAGAVTDLEVALGYHAADPYAVTARFLTRDGDVIWTFARELLSRGLTDPAGEGDVQVWPCLDSDGRAMVVIELRSPDGELIAQARTQDVYRFVSRTLALVPAGLEGQYLDVDRLIDRLLATDGVS